MDLKNSVEKKDILVKKLDDMKEQLRNLGYPDQYLAGREKLPKIAMTYNLMIEEIRRLEEKPRYDPIERLPEEVSVAVLKQAIVKESHGSSFISIEVVLLLTLVSSKWRRLIESTPTLWSDIVLDDEIEDLAMKVTISLFFSREAYLVVQLVDPLSRWSEISSIVLPHIGRIRSIYWVGAVSFTFIRDVFIFPIGQLWTPQLRSINRIRNHGMIGDGDKIFLGSQNGHLHSITGATLTREVLRLPSVRSLRELATHEDARRVLAEALPHLEKVEFLEKLYTDKESLPLIMGTLSWTSLTYRQGVMETLTSLLSRLPLLRDLILVIRYDDLSQLISSMRDLKVLHSLDLTLWNVPNKTFVPPATIEPLYQVRTFIFRERRYGPLSEAEWAKVSQLPNAFFSLIPNVELLEIQSSINQMVYKLTSAVGFRKVHTLLVRLVGLSVSAFGGFEFSESVRNLNINFKGAIGSIAPGVERLQVDELDLDGAGSQCGTVQRLHFNRFEGSSNSFQPFVTITNIFVGGDEAVTRFCAIIATSPDDCPALHTLSFGRFPDLDILFIMLERRNLGLYPGTARIRKLVLPTHLPLSNFKPIRDLLRGRVVERQSNFEASVQGNIDILLDPNISGCIACHKAQAFCTLAGKFHRIGSRGLAPPIQPYPASIEDILSTWEARSFRTEISKVRSPTCGDPTEITEDSLEWSVTEAETDMTMSASQ